MKILKVFVIVLLFTSKLATADCFDDAAHRYHVNPWVLRGIAHVESRFNPKAINKNKNGTIDVGMMQTNSIHFNRLSKYGIRPQDLTNACTSIHVAAFMLQEKMNKYGNTWQAVGAYHSETPHLRQRYAFKVKKILSSWAKRMNKK